MGNESGDLNLLGKFRKLIDHVSADTNYKPSMFSAIVSEPRALATGSCDTLETFVVRLNCVLIRSLPLAVLTLVDTDDHSLA
jgi:hypothetical protein